MNNGLIILGKHSPLSYLYLFVVYHYISTTIRYTRSLSELLWNVKLNSETATPTHSLSCTQCLLHERVSLRRPQRQ